MNNDLLNATRQEHEAFLADLEALAVQALVTREWAPVYAHLATVTEEKIDLTDSFKSEVDFVEAISFINRLLGGASTKDLPRPGADSFSKPTRAIFFGGDGADDTVRWLNA